MVAVVVAPRALAQIRRAIEHWERDHPGPDARLRLRRCVADLGAGFDLEHERQAAEDLRNPVVSDAADPLREPRSIDGADCETFTTLGL